MHPIDLQAPYADHAPLLDETPHEENPVAEVSAQIRAGVQAHDPYADIVIAQAGGLRAIKPGLRRQRYRQGV